MTKDNDYYTIDPEMMHELLRRIEAQQLAIEALTRALNNALNNALKSKKGGK